MAAAPKPAAIRAALGGRARPSAMPASAELANKAAGTSHKLSVAQDTVMQAAPAISSQRWRTWSARMPARTLVMAAATAKAEIIRAALAGATPSFTAWGTRVMTTAEPVPEMAAKVMLGSQKTGLLIICQRRRAGASTGRVP